MCNTPPTLIILQVNLAHYFIYTTDLQSVTDHWWCTTALDSQTKSKLHYDQQSVGRSIMVSGAHLGHVTNFSFRQLLFAIL
jgi:hypothetical protein